jgi:hypothetical protein
MDRAWILSSTRWCSFSTYITPTVTSPSKTSPVRPSKRTDWPVMFKPAVCSAVLDVRLLGAVEDRAREVHAVLHLADRTLEVVSSIESTTSVRSSVV